MANRNLRKIKKHMEKIWPICDIERISEKKYPINYERAKKQLAKKYWL